jgi:hypothetical protein
LLATDKSADGVKSEETEKPTRLPARCSPSVLSINRTYVPRQQQLLQAANKICLQIPIEEPLVFLINLCNSKTARSGALYLQASYSRAEISLSMDRVRYNKAITAYPRNDGWVSPKNTAAPARYMSIAVYATHPFPHTTPTPQVCSIDLYGYISEDQTSY